MNIFGSLRKWANWFRHEERQTCYRRMTEPGPWERQENLDRWESDTWSWWCKPESWRAWLTGRIGGGGTFWEWPWAPRTCSFCGSVHPEDAIRLTEEGWTVEGTTKPYKRYLRPPGYKQWRLQQESGNAVFQPYERWLPVPPVKLYVGHVAMEKFGVPSYSLATRKEFDG